MLGFLCSITLGMRHPVSPTPAKTPNDLNTESVSSEHSYKQNGFYNSDVQKVESESDVQKVDSESDVLRNGNPNFNQP